MVFLAFARVGLLLRWRRHAALIERYIIEEARSSRYGFLTWWLSLDA